MTDTLHMQWSESILNPNLQKQKTQTKISDPESWTPLAKDMVWDFIYVRIQIQNYT